MFERIIVPVDGSERSLNAVRVASALAAECDACLEAVTVVAPGTDPEFEQGRLATRLDELGELPVAPQTVAVSGAFVAEAIAEHVREVPSTLVVMSSTGRGRSAAVLGSVADELLHSDIGPIAVLGPRATAARSLAGELVIPVDGSTLAETAIDAAADWAVAFGARPWVVAVLATAAGARPGLDLSERAYVARTAAELQRHTRRPVEYEVLHGGSPATAIVDWADSIDAALIVMSTHGRSGLRRVVLGSVAAEIVQRASCPVVLHRPTNTAEVRDGRNPVAVTAMPNGSLRRD